MMEDIPAFLRLSQEERTAMWKGRKLTKLRKLRAADIMVTRDEDASTRRFRREVEKQQAAQKAARFKMLRETYGK